MITKPFPNNPVLKSMTYHDDKLSIEFKRSGQIRTYLAAPELAYKLFYSKSADDSLKIYSNEIKGHCRVVNVK